jgi:hypothetical protein
MIVPVNVIGISIMLSFYVRRMTPGSKRRTKWEGFHSGWMDILLPRERSLY